MEKRLYRPRGEEAFDLLASKLARPHIRSGTAPREPLIGQLGRESSGRIVVVVAPAGYGKTTLLAQWADRDERSFAWVSLDERDNDPKVLLTYVAEAIDAVESIDGSVYAALASPASSVHGTVLPRLCAALASMSTSVVLVLDDVHLLHDTQCQAALSVLADHVPQGSLLVLAGRTLPQLRVARLRAEGRIVEIGSNDLALTVAEAGTLLSSAGVTLADEDVVALWARTEGWPVGLYLAALSLREGGSSEAAAAWFGGEDRFVSEYVESEFLDLMPRSQRAFLTRTSVLERLSGPLCDAVLRDSGSGARLEDLAGSNMLLVPLDRRGQWFRYHHLFSDMLQAQLERQEPGLANALRRRAAEWHVQRDMPEVALEYSILAEDVETVASLLPGLWGAVYRQGRIDTLQRWFGWLDDQGGIEHHPMNAVNAAFLAAVTGDAALAERWSGTVERLRSGASTWPADTYLDALAATLRALSCRHGIEQMRVDADAAAHKFAEANLPFIIAPLLQGTARMLLGDLDEADTVLATASATEVEHPSTADVSATAWCERSLVAMARDEWDRAADFADRAHVRLQGAGIEESFACAAVSALRARFALLAGDLGTAERERTVAMRLRPLLTYAFPHWACQIRLELIRVHLALGDQAGARTTMREVDDILRVRPDLGALLDQARGLRSTVAAVRGPVATGASSLTAAELRVLPLLTTHLTYQEIADELSLSKHTIHAQTRSLFRKLGASSRSEAVARSRELALLEG